MVGDLRISLGVAWQYKIMGNFVFGFEMIHTPSIGGEESVWRGRGLVW